MTLTETKSGRASLYIGESACDEDAAQYGQPDYTKNAVRQCRALINQLRRMHGTEPTRKNGDTGARLCIKSEHHSDGPMYHVACVFDPDDEAQVNYAYLCESEIPEKWDAEARAELGLT